MRYLDTTNTQSCARLTAFVRHDDSELGRAVRDALAERHIDAETSAVADFCPTSELLDDGAILERHHLVIVTSDRHAYVGTLERSTTSAGFVAWQRVPSTWITNRDDIIRRINANRREGRDWNTGIDPAMDHPRDVVYNELIETACAFLDSSGATAPDG